MLLYRKGLFIIQDCWFDLCNPYPKCDLVRYYQMLEEPHNTRKIRKRFSTLFIDLQRSREEIYAEFSKETKYEIRRAERELWRVEFDDKPTMRQLVNYKSKFDTFAKNKRLKPLNLAKLLSYLREDNLFIGSVYNQQGILVSLHFYYKNGHTARLLNSATFFDIESKTSVGRANRFLHWQEMLHFKNSQYLRYDLGGIYLGNDKSDSRNGVNSFKRSFGGEIENSHNYIVGNSLKGNIIVKVLLRKERNSLGQDF